MGSPSFLMTLVCLDVSSKKRCLKRHFTYHLKAHTRSNKLVLKVSAQKKGGGEVMTATNMCSNFGSKWLSPPLRKLPGLKPYGTAYLGRVRLLTGG